MTAIWFIYSRGKTVTCSPALCNLVNMDYKHVGAALVVVVASSSDPNLCRLHSGCIAICQTLFFVDNPVFPRTIM